MAYINGVNSSGSGSSLYGNRNVISGLASGMDTEAMIENAVSGHKMKIENLIKQRTVSEWKQEIYRGLIDKMAVFNEKYMSFESGTNLLSNAFFDAATQISANGTYADKISATGKPTSDVEILGVKQLATKASYTVGNSADIIESQSIDLNAEIKQSNTSGTFTINYGEKQKVVVDLGNKVFNNTEEFAQAVRDALAEKNIVFDGGKSEKASECIEVSVSGDQITFSDKKTAGNDVFISAVSGDLATKIGITAEESNASHNPVIDLSGKALYETTKAVDSLKNKKINITLDGVNHEISMEGFENAAGSSDLERVRQHIQDETNRLFGNGKIQIDLSGDKLEISTHSQGSALEISGDGAEILGFKNVGSNFVDTSKSIGELWGENFFNGMTPAAEPDKDGNQVYDFVINGVKVGSFNKDSKLSDVMNAINNNREAGVKVSYSKTVKQFRFESVESGAAGRIDFGSDPNSLAHKMFGVGGDLKNGQDAVLSMRVNGTVLDGVTRSNNTFNVDGMNVSLKGTFGDYGQDNALMSENGVQIEQSKLEEIEAGAVNFTARADTDKIIDAVKNMVKDYNALAEEIKKTYSTLPNTRSNGKPYEPLSDKARESMSESEVKAYEEKAKAGLLFADRDISSLHSELRDAISLMGAAGKDMEAIGLKTNYKNGMTTLVLDENKLKEVLESDPDKVKRVFTESKETNGEYNGLMHGLKETINQYGSVMGEKGILVNKAGSALAPSTIHSNTMQEEIDAFNVQIEKWEIKMNSQIDYYTRQFSQLEKLIGQMNSQSSSMAGMMGGF